MDTFAQLHKDLDTIALTNTQANQMSTALGQTSMIQTASNLKPTLNASGNKGGNLDGAATIMAGCELIQSNKGVWDKWWNEKINRNIMMLK